MDGVIVDLFGYLKTYYQINHQEYSYRNFSIRKILQLLLKEQSIFLKAPPKNDAHHLIEHIELLAKTFNYQVEILTSIPPKIIAPKAAEHKQAWLKKHYPHKQWNFKIGPYPHQKHKFAQEQHILIDDTLKNIEQWKAAGGIGILHENSRKTIAQLEHIFLTTNESKI